MSERVLLIWIVMIALLAGACSGNSPQALGMSAVPMSTVSSVAAEVTAINITAFTPTVMATDTVANTSPVAATSIPTATLAVTVIPTSTPLAVTPFFPLGFMGPADEALFPQIAAAGFNVVQEFRNIQEIDEAEDYLNQAQAVRLKVIQNMPSCRAYKSDDPLCDEFNAHLWSEVEWGEFIAALSKHDNLVAWFLPDEMTDYEAAANLYQWVKKYDPQQRPVYGNPGTFEFSKIVRFPMFSDFLWVACYPEYYKEPRAIVTYGMRLDAVATQGTTDRWGAILQFFDRAEFEEGEGYPTARELRADSYQAIIGGATGLWYFDYEMGQNLPGLWETTVTIADEIVGSGRLQEIILSPAVPQTIVKTIVSGPSQSPLVAQGETYDSIQMLQKEHNGTYLLAVNLATDGVVVEFSNLPPEAVAVEVLFENRTISIADGSFQDNFIQDDVHIYRVITEA